MYMYVPTYSDSAAERSSRELLPVIQEAAIFVGLAPEDGYHLLCKGLF